MNVSSKLVKRALMNTGKYDKVSFSRSNHSKNKWSVYLRPKHLRRGKRFHISFVDGGFVCEDWIANRKQARSIMGQADLFVRPVATPLLAIRKVCRALNEGYRVYKR